MKKFLSLPPRWAGCLLTLGLLLAGNAQAAASKLTLPASASLFTPLAQLGTLLHLQAQSDYVQGWYENNRYDRCAIDFVLTGLFGGVNSNYFLRTDLGEFAHGQLETFPGSTIPIVRFYLGYGVHGSFVSVTYAPTGEVQEGEFSYYPDCR
ncbi:hypothetical protein [Hymenobacter cavernae]|uniref:DUF4251 domain-containing protein n=1 Tax=Hymenobacter cavernae TaxID=2044852 RepID=A0ABQ1UBJ7_9BACT|nr:hypothetical protein [Hymenobacter cavernae]GGF12640.1 hypothetical protein GCM10011383_24790 [Hymenobacter cavernae]